MAKKNDTRAVSGAAETKPQSVARGNQHPLDAIRALKEEANKQKDGLLARRQELVDSIEAAQQEIDEIDEALKMFMRLEPKTRKPRKKKGEGEAGEQTGESTANDDAGDEDLSVLVDESDDGANETEADEAAAQ